MQLHNLILEVFHTEEYQLDPLEKGLTNKNYLLQIEQNKYVIRVPYDDNENIVVRSHETQALAAVCDFDLDVPYIYYDQHSGIKITEFIPNLSEFKECTAKDKIERTARLMKRFHSLNLKIDSCFEPIKRLYLYKSKVNNPIYDLSEYEHVIDMVKHNDSKQILCHNDWVSGNILFSEQKDYLIDYEYAANNDPIFDVMSYLSENAITDTQERKRFYAIYFDEFDDNVQQQLDMWEDFQNLLWCYWAMMMYESRKEDIYKKIAADKYHALKTRSS